MSKFRFLSLWLVVICTAVYILQVFFPWITDNFLLQSSDVFSRPWILFTSIFLHGSLEHLFYNMFSLGLFGSIAEKIAGTKKFILIFLLSGLVASIGSAIFYEASLGASGAIFGLMGFMAISRPKMMIWSYGVPMPAIIAVFIWIGINFAGLFFPTDTAYAAHLFGLFVGIILAIPYMRKGEEKEDKIPEKELEEWENRYMKNKEGI